MIKRLPLRRFSLMKIVFPESLSTLIPSLSLRIVFATLIAFALCSPWACHCISRCYKNSHRPWCSHALHHSDGVLLRISRSREMVNKADQYSSLSLCILQSCGARGYMPERHVRRSHANNDDLAGWHQPIFAPQIP